MDDSSSINLIAPCGLDCGMCAFYVDGEIMHHAKRLIELLTGFENLAPLLSDWKSEFSHYADFPAILESFDSGHCLGCRENRVPDNLAGCSFRTCSSLKGIEYCGSCSEFPCQDAPDKYPNMAFIWNKNSKRIQEIGIERYIEEIKDKPWYNNYL